MKIIGERINCSIRGVAQLIQAMDLDALKNIAKSQENCGADYIDVNVGTYGPEVMAQVVSALQDTVSVPLWLDSDDPEKVRGGLSVYDYERGLPVVNSITEVRLQDYAGIRSRYKFGAVLMVSERFGDRIERNTTVADAVSTARRLVDKLTGFGLEIQDLSVDPGIVPLAADEESSLARSLKVVEEISGTLPEVNTVIGISNLTAYLPDALDKLSIQRAYVQMAEEAGLKMVIGDPCKNYAVSEEDGDYVDALKKILWAEYVPGAVVKHLFPLCRGEAVYGDNNR